MKFLGASPLADARLSFHSSEVFLQKASNNNAPRGGVLNPSYAIKGDQIYQKWNILFAFSVGISILLMKGCLDKIFKQRMGIHGAGFEFRMELTPEKPGMLFIFYNFNEIFFRGKTGKNQTALFQRFFICVIEFISVPMSF